MKRRSFVTGLGLSGLAACSRPAEHQAAAAAPRETFEWKMVTTWPPNFPALGTGAATLAKRIETASGGRIRIKIYAAGELIPALEVFDAVSRGTAEIGHGAAYYWKGQSEAAQFFAAMPFGMNAHEMDGWLYHGGGLELWREVYEPFNLMPFAAGNTGVQMGGWFNREIRSPDDLRGLKMRIPGLGGEVLKRAGGTPVVLAGGDIFTALQTGSIDATEWVGPYNDVASGLNEAAKYYYYPGWQEPCATLECILNKDAWNSLPPDLQSIVSIACQSVNNDMMAEFTARNAQTLAQLEQEGKVQILPFPDAVLSRLHEISKQVIAELVDRDDVAAKVWKSYSAFLQQSTPWQRISEQASLKARAL